MLRKNKLHKYEPKRHITLTYKTTQRKKNAQIRVKRAPNTTLKNYAKKKKCTYSNQKKHLQLPYKIYVKKKFAQSRVKKPPYTTVKILCQEKKKKKEACTNSTQIHPALP